MPQNAPHVAVTVNIAFQPRSGDLILTNAGLAKPILPNLVYSKACEWTYALFATHNRMSWRAPPPQAFGLEAVGMSASWGALDEGMAPFNRQRYSRGNEAIE
jgi:hypothetical protein